MLIPFKELFSKHAIKTNGVLHLGANTGQEAQAYDELGIKNVIWVEALPNVYAHLVTHLEKYPTHKALLACVSDQDGQEVTFHIANNSAQSSSMLEFGTHAQEHPTVKYVDHVQMVTIRVDTLLRKFKHTVGPDWFLNADLQGAELLALRGMGDLLREFKYAYIEVNMRHLYRGCALVGEVDAYLGAYGFREAQTKWTGAGWGDRFYQKLL